MNEKGYVRLYRKTLENPVVMKDSSHLSIWIYLLLNATHKEMPVMFKGKKTVLQPGQLITGTLSIAKKLKIDKMKVQRTLNEFESDKQIEQQTSNKNRLITILKWEEYQNIDKQNDKQLINNRETTDKQLITNNNEKNVKNEINKKENIKRKKFEKPSIEEITQYCNERNNSINAEAFYDFYESKDWCVGKNKMKDWKACVRTWEQRSDNNKPKETKLPDWWNKDFKEEISDDEKRKIEAIRNGTWKP